MIFCLWFIQNVGKKYGSYPQGWRQRLKGDYIMITTVEYVKGQKLTKEQIMEIEEVKKKPIVYDEDSPELYWRSKNMTVQYKVMCTTAQGNKPLRGCGRHELTSEKRKDFSLVSITPAMEKAFALAAKSRNRYKRIG